MSDTLKYVAVQVNEDGEVSVKVHTGQSCVDIAAYYGEQNWFGVESLARLDPNPNYWPEGQTLLLIPVD